MLYKFWLAWYEMAEPISDWEKYELEKENW